MNQIQVKMKVFIVAVILAAAALPISGIFGKIIPEHEIKLSIDVPVVEIPDGKIIGSNNFTVDRRVPYEAFRGIPFAQPPVGNLRFAAPAKNEKWTGYWDATEDANICIQGTGNDVRGSEDCLYINVYAPKGASGLAVMVWIHGGAFTSGDSSYRSFGPDYFLEDGVVFVSFNYRLGIFGFLSTEDRTASGNWGLKDQVLALEWVKDNIKYFGGDPNRITIFGESAGGAAVSYLLQIPNAQGLFNAAIIQSGTSENLWALTTRARQSAFQVGYNLGIPTLLANTLINRLRKVEADTLQKTAMSVLNQVYVVNPLRGLPWAPIIEVETADAVFTEKSDEYLRSGRYPSKVPIMIGYTSNEAGHAHGLPDLLRQYLLLFDVSPNNLVPFSLTSANKLKRLAANDIKLNFFGLGPVRNQFHEVVRFINIDQFTRGTIRMAKNIAPFAPVYFYIFGYEGVITGENPYDGVGHAEELEYLFRSYREVYSQDDLVVRAKLIRLWTNFAKHFNPTPKREALLDKVIWPVINPKSSNLDYVWLNFTIIKDQNPAHEDYRFYENLFGSYGEPPFSTY